MVGGTHLCELAQGMVCRFYGVVWSSNRSSCALQREGCCQRRVALLWIKGVRALCAP